MAEAEGTIQETEEEQEVLSLSTEEVAQLLPFLTAQLHGFQTSEERSGRDQPLSPDRHLEAVQACLGAAFQNFLLTDLHRVQGRVDVFEMPLLVTCQQLYTLLKPHASVKGGPPPELQSAAKALNQAADKLFVHRTMTSLFSSSPRFDIFEQARTQPAEVPLDLLDDIAESDFLTDAPLKKTPVRKVKKLDEMKKGAEEDKSQAQKEKVKTLPYPTRSLFAWLESGRARGKSSDKDTSKDKDKDEKGDKSKKPEKEKVKLTPEEEEKRRKERKERHKKKKAKKKAHKEKRKKEKELEGQLFDALT